MKALVEVATAVTCAYAWAIILIAATRTRSLNRRLFVWPLATTMLFFPLMISREFVVPRALACFPCLELALKVCDLSRENRMMLRISWKDTLWFLIPFPSLDVSFARRNRRVFDGSVVREMFRVAIGSTIIALMFMLLFASNRAEFLQERFWLDHACKVLLFVPTLEAISQLSLGVEHLLGYSTQPIINQAYRSRTVSEFWRRYNNRIHNWLIDNVFVQLQVSKRPALAIVAAFFVSAAFHELAFGIATSRFDGYQFTFFIIQAPAMFVSAMLERVLSKFGTAGDIVLRLSTVVWFGTSSIFFFHGVNRVFPFLYCSQPWLP